MSCQNGFVHWKCVRAMPARHPILFWPWPVILMENAKWCRSSGGRWVGSCTRVLHTFYEDTEQQPCNLHRYTGQDTLGGAGHKGGSCRYCNNMPVMLIRVIRDCNVRSDFYDVNRVLFKDGRVLSRFLIMVAAVQWYLSPHTNPWTPKVGWMQDKLFIYLFDLRLVRDAEIFAPKPSRFHQSRCMGRLETAFRAVQDSH